MAKIATRRMASSRQAMSSWPASSVAAPRSSSGTTRPLQTMMASATEFDDHHRGRRRQAADEGEQRHGLGSRRQRQRQHVHVGVDGALGQDHAGPRPRSAPRTG